VGGERRGVAAFEATDADAGAWAAAWRTALARAIGMAADGSEGSVVSGGSTSSARLVWTEEGAELEGLDGKPTTTLALWPLPEAAWSRLRANLAGRPELLVALRAGALPVEVLEQAAVEGAALLPAGAEDLIVDCDCGGAPGCAHVQALVARIGEALEREPERLLMLRGGSLAALLPAVAVEVAGLPGGAPAAGDAEDGARETIAEESLDGFWTAGRGLESFRARPRPPEHALVLLRRLGQPEFLEGDAAMWLGPAYALIAERALGLAYGEGEVESGHE
jgi:uncharacterized Zn finger protein